MTEYQKLMFNYSIDFMQKIVYNLTVTRTLEV